MRGRPSTSLLLAAGASVTGTATVTNTGSAPLDLSSVDVTGSGFSVGEPTCLGVVVDPGGTCTIDVRVVGDAPGAVSGQLRGDAGSAGSGQHDAGW